MRTTKMLALLVLVLFIVGFTSSANAQDSSGEFSILMDDLVTRIIAVENAYNPGLIGSLARTSRLEAYSGNWPDIESIIPEASGRTDSNSLKLWMLAEASRSMDPSADGFLPVLEELMVRALVLRCELRGITVGTVMAYIRARMASFVADRGNFAHPSFDSETLTAGDNVVIYFAGFGLVVLVHMEGGVDSAIEIYRESTELRGYLGNQLVFRGVDLDMAGLPMLEAVLNDPDAGPMIAEFYYGMVAGKLVGPGSQFGSELVLSTEFKNALADMVLGHIRIPERLESRLEVEYYGVDFTNTVMGPESLLGLLGPIAVPGIVSLLSSNVLMEQVSGLEAMRWFDQQAYPDDIATLFGHSEPIMGTVDFTLAVLAMEAFEADARYYGEPYVDARRGRLQLNLPIWCDLLRRAYEHEGVEYLSSTAWLDIYAEGSMVDQLECAIPMVVEVVNSDWAGQQSGEEVYLPEGEIELVTYFIPANTIFFDDSQVAVLGFLEAELNSGDVNPFRVWSYVNYLDAAVSSGIILSDEWLNALVRLDTWAENAPLLINGDEFNALLDELIW